MRGILDIGKTVLRIEAEAILHGMETLSEDFEKTVLAIEACPGKVVVTGIGKSGYVARKIASTLVSTGTPAVYLHPAESAHGDLGIIQPEDVILALSYGGASPELMPILHFAKRRGQKFILMTGNSRTELAKGADLILPIRVPQEACPIGLAPTASSTLTLALGDALAMVLLERRGFTENHFRELHPGGALGAKLLKVSDIMSKQVPCLDGDSLIKEALSLMSQGEVRGACAVLENGALVGVLTDGDLRRLLEKDPNPLQRKVKECMTAQPRTVDADEFVEKALFFMEQFRINVLFVTEGAAKKPVGILHIQDLIRSKAR